MFHSVLRTTAFAAAVFAFANANTGAYAQELHALPEFNQELDQAQLLTKIHALTDDTQDKFVLDLTSKADADLTSRFAKIENDIFAPAASDMDAIAVGANVATATANSQSVFNSLVVADAESAMNSKIVNIENPYEPHLPLSPFMMAFIIHD